MVEDGGVLSEFGLILGTTLGMMLDGKIQDVTLNEGFSSHWKCGNQRVLPEVTVANCS
jgi:hypothetical protein